MVGHASRLNATLQDRSARWTVCIVMAALTAFSAVTNKRHRCGS